MDKPTKPTDLMPRSFGGIKNNFSNSLQISGYEPNIPAIYGGDNLNYQLDATGKELDYCEKIADYINDIPIGKTITVDDNNKLIYGNFPSIATTNQVGMVKPDGETIAIEDDGTISVSGVFANQDLSNLTSLGNSRLHYAPFAINTGTTTVGKNTTLTYSGANITCSACTITTADGRTKVFDEGSTYSITTEGDGDYYIFKNFSTGSLSLVREYEFAISNTYGQKNIARQNQTTSNFANNAQYAFDGNLNTYAATGTSITIANNAFIGQAGVSNPIKVVRIHQGLSNANYCPSFRLQYSNDNGSTWNTLQTTTGGVTNSWQTLQVSTYTPTGSSHRFRVLAVTFGGTQGTNQWVVSELELYARTTYWLDTSASPAVLKVYDLATDTYSVNNNLVCIGQCSVASNTVTSITNNLFNDNGYSDGTSTEGGFAMPSNQVYQYTIGASGAYYVAPGNGWVSAAGGIIDQNTILQLAGISTIAGSCSRYFSYGGDGYGGRALIPVRKGDIFQFRYSGTPTFLWFCYTQGSEREA